MGNCKKEIFYLTESAIKNIEETCKRTGWPKNRVVNFLLSHGTVVPLIREGEHFPENKKRNPN